jgi:two-component system response regulator HydG
LIVDDHLEMAKVIAEQLGDAGYATEIATSGAEAIAAARDAAPDLVLTDLRMEKVDGLDVLQAIKELDPTIPVILMTAFGAVDSAVEAIRKGAFHYLTKPLQLKEVLIYVDRALADRRIRTEHQVLRRVLAERPGLGNLVGRSEPMQRVYELIKRVAPAAAPVLIRGESGTGKELVARALHLEGPRRDRPFVAVNCTALPEALLESELYGHARGAFTGATSARRGLFVEADGGTLFLDEIGDMPPALQAKLLRTLQDGEVRAVGADAMRQVDVRVVAATHQDLEERVERGHFRADLFYRLNVVALQLPPLRSRPEDIPPLVEHFLARARERNPSSSVERFSQRLIARLCAASWPGNVRELENAIERLVLMATSEMVDVEALETHLPRVRSGLAPFVAAQEGIIPLRQLEDEYITFVLGRCEGNKTRAAELLRIDASTIYRRERSAAR